MGKLESTEQLKRQTTLSKKQWVWETSAEKWGPFPVSLTDFYLSPTHRDMQSWLYRSRCHLKWSKECDQVHLRCQCVSLQHIGKNYNSRFPLSCHHHHWTATDVWNVGLSNTLWDTRSKTGDNIAAEILKPKKNYTFLVIKVSASRTSAICGFAKWRTSVPDTKLLFSPYSQCLQSFFPLAFCLDNTHLPDWYQ